MALLTSPIRRMARRGASGRPNPHYPTRPMILSPRLQGFAVAVLLLGFEPLWGPIPTVGASPVESPSEGLLWTTQFGSTEADFGTSLAVDAAGVYVAGYTYGAIPGQTSSGLSDAFLRKCDAEGNLLWIRQFGTPATDNANSVAVDASGIYVAGYTAGTFPGQTSAGRWDAYLRKYDATGNLGWTKQFGTSMDDGASAVAVGASDSFVAGYTDDALPGQTSNGSRDAFLRKYDSTGTEAWTRQFGTAGYDIALAAAVDASGVYVAGYTAGTFPGQTSAGGFDAFLLKYNANGDIVWASQFGTSSDDFAFSIATDGSGIYAAGYTTGAFLGQTSSGLSDAFLQKYDGTGTEVWTRQFGTPEDDFALSVSMDGLGVYVAGYTSGSLPSQSSGGRNDSFLRKYDSTGTEVWTRQFGTPEDDFAYAAAKALDGVYAGGHTSGTLPGGTSSGKSDAFLVRLAETPDPPSGVVAIPGDDRVDLAWDPPAFDGGSPVTGYRLYRGTDTASMVRVADLGEVLIYADRGVLNGVTYFYRVGAVNAVGEGVASSAVVATPRGSPRLTITSPTSSLTNDPSVTVAGFTEPDATVTVGGDLSSVAADGRFNHTLTLPEGTHVVEVVATNPIGRETRVAIEITIDTTPPILLMNSPADGLTTNSSTVLVSGTTEVGADLVVNGIRLRVAPDGSFAMQLALRPGTTLVTAVAADAAGNSATRSVTVTYTDPIPGLEQDLDDLRRSLDGARIELEALSGRLSLLLALLGAVLTVQAVQVVLFIRLVRRNLKQKRNPPIQSGAAPGR